MEISNTITTQFAGPPNFQIVPPELWIYIFLHALPVSYPSLSGGRPEQIRITDPPLIPLVISSVCPLWRNIAHDTPQLWETCWLSYRNPELNHLWIRRAGTLPLTLYGLSTRRTTLEWRAGHSESGNEAERAFIRSILPYRHRWKVIRIDTGPLLEARDPEEWLTEVPDGSFSPCPLESPISWHAPLLEAFKTEARFNALNVSTPTWVVPLVSNAPALRELKLFDLKHFNLSHFPERLPHLVDLEVLCATIGDLLLLLSSLPLLRKFTGSVSYLGAHTTHLQHLVHTKLECLHLRHEWQAEEGTTIMNYLTLPSLRVFHASHAIWLTSSFRMLFALLERSECHLTELAFVDMKMDSEDLISLLEDKAVNLSLKGLTVYESTLIGSVLFRFLIYDPKDPRLPLLECLTLREHHLELDFEHSKDGVLAELVASRCSPQNPPFNGPERASLRNVSIAYFSPSLHVLDLALISPLPQTSTSTGKMCTIELGLIRIGYEGRERDTRRYQLPISATRTDDCF